MMKSHCKSSTTEQTIWCQHFLFSKWWKSLILYYLIPCWKDLDDVLFNIDTNHVKKKWCVEFERENEMNSNVPSIAESILYLCLETSITVSDEPLMKIEHKAKASENRRLIVHKGLMAYLLLALWWNPTIHSISCNPRVTNADEISQETLIPHYWKMCPEGGFTALLQTICIFLNRNSWIFLRITLIYVPKDLINIEWSCQAESH